MGGVDKGLQPFRQTTLAGWAVNRLLPQVGHVALSANRQLASYLDICGSVWPDDALPGYAGPLAGFLAGLQQCATPFLVTVACDTPDFPVDLVSRLAFALERDDAQIAVAATFEAGRQRAQPTFSLMRSKLLPDLMRFTAEGGRKIDAWAGAHRRTDVVFEDPEAFANANTFAELERLERASTP